MLKHGETGGFWGYKNSKSTCLVQLHKGGKLQLIMIIVGTEHLYFNVYDGGHFKIIEPEIVE